MPDGRTHPGRSGLRPDEKKRLGRAVAGLLGWWIVAIAALSALIVWHLVRRGRVLRANLDPPRIVSFPDEFDRPRPGP